MWHESRESVHDVCDIGGTCHARVYINCVTYVNVLYEYVDVARVTRECACVTSVKGLCDICGRVAWYVWCVTYVVCDICE